MQPAEKGESNMSKKFEHDEHGWYHAADWFKFGIGTILFLVMISIVFRAIAFVLPILIIGALIFFGLSLFKQNGTDPKRWERWGEQFGELAERWGRDFGARAERWARQFEHSMTGCSREKQDDLRASDERPRKRKNDEEVMEIEYEELSTAGRPKAKRHADAEEYL